MKLDAKSTIEAGKAILGIELGSTRIKAVLIDQDNKPWRRGSSRGHKDGGSCCKHRKRS